MKPMEQMKIRHTQELSLDQHGNRQLRTCQSIELTQEAVEAGFLKELPGSQLAIYLYLLTHVNQDFFIITNPTIIASLLPYTPLEVERGLKMLEAQGYITLSENGVTDKYIISLARTPVSAGVVTPSDPSRVAIANGLEQIAAEVAATGSVEQKAAPNTEPAQDASPKVEAVEYILRQKVFSEEDLVRAITNMIHSEHLTPSMRQEIDYWFKTFDKEVIKELIRRTYEAYQRNPDFQSQAYIRKIANEWVAEQIFSLADLGEKDKIYRETRQLLEEYGIENYKDITRTHSATIYNWIASESEQDFALSIEVARFAIQEAIRQKSDGRPSLTYIENNFIKPFKENRIKTVEEAREYLRQRSERSAVPYSDKTSSPNKAPKETKWQSGIDFTRFREN